MLARLKWNYYIYNSLTNIKGCYMFAKHAHPKINQTNTNTIIKLKRKKVDDSTLSKTSGEYSSSESHMTVGETAYQDKINKKIEENLATQKFYNYELSRGEDLIDAVPINPYYQYKMADLQLEVKARQSLVNKLKGVKVFRDPNRLQKLKAAVAGFQTKKHRYELEEFQKKLNQYPGSVKGPNPEDDPVVYGEYVLKIIPDWLLGEIKASQKKMTVAAAQQEIRQLSSQTSFMNQYLTDKLSFQPRFPVPEDQNDRPEEQLQYVSETGSTFVRYSAVPLYPHGKFQQYHDYMAKIRMWQSFKSYYNRANRKNKIKQLQRTLNGVSQSYWKKIEAETFTNPPKFEQQELKEDPQKQQGKNKKQKGSKKQKKSEVNLKKNIKRGFQFQPKTSSLYTYFKTLPKQIQEHPGVRTVYLGLEYSSPDIPYQVKEDTLNKAAKRSLPLDKFSNALLDEVLDRTRNYLTPHLVDRIYNMSPEFTWDIHEFLTEVKDEKLRSISTVKEKELSFVQPPALERQYQEGMANLPVDLWDNEDGFWDEYIDQKLKRQQLVQPLSKKPKKHFIH